MNLANSSAALKVSYNYYLGLGECFNLATKSYGIIAALCLAKGTFSTLPNVQESININATFQSFLNVSTLI